MKSARESALIGGSLLAMCCLVHGAAAFEQGKPAAAPVQALPALPSFLEGNRLLDLQEAWRTALPAPAPKQGAAATPDASAPNSAPSEEAAIKAARSAIKRAGGASRDAAAVRKRAEELSQRFGASGAVSGPEKVDEAPIASTPPYAIGAEPSADRGPQSDEKEAGPGTETAGPVAPGASHLGADTATGALPDAAAPVQNSEIASKPRLGTARSKSVLPPLPLRAPRFAAVPPDPPVVHRSRAATSSRPAPARSTTRDAKREVFPAYMHSFGWNPKP